ncbi:hypothetical protein AGR13a_Cc110026 [Agrobacterium genomosp. 13 str. CFBP 6927]|jgi:hypothetical protein|uniref:Secreted protein n=1 Tax=Agrobacterium genomosp. 13 str. CFBP 6927 TaxID=1183428 RepID=A0ABP2BFV7_9HYPH|nr:hypothetical protein AGR13a_Cc110026 [Agrobacterium genomosp. 13 str. CFBP 6927]
MFSMLRLIRAWQAQGPRSFVALSSTLIPVLVTGIQATRVCAAAELFQPKDLGWLDSCDEHRNEGRTGATAHEISLPHDSTNISSAYPD